MASITKRTTQDGKTYYTVRIRLKGYPLQTESFNRLTDAKRWAASTESAIKEGRHFKTAEAKKHTLSELIDRYIKEELPKKKDSKKREMHLAWWRVQIGDYLLSDITQAMLVECRNKLFTEPTRLGIMRGNTTVVRYMATLSHAFTIATKEWMWINDSPMRNVSRPTEQKGRIRFLSDEERTRLLQACKESNQPFLYAIVVLALATGARKSEIMGLTWDNVDLKRGLATLTDTKNGDTRAAHLTGHALAVVKNMAKIRRIDSKLLFPSQIYPHKPVYFRAAWEAALKTAEIDNFHFHDLRHTCASYLAMNGASLAEIAEILGHKTLAMVKRYAHLSDGHVSNVVASMNAKIFGDV